MAIPYQDDGQAARAAEELCVGRCPQAKEGTVSHDENKALLRRIPDEVWSKRDGPLEGTVAPNNG